MTTITFEEDLKISGDNKTMNVESFLTILEENGYFPVLRELDESEITPEIKEKYEEAKKADDYVNI